MRNISKTVVAMLGVLALAPGASADQARRAKATPRAQKMTDEHAKTTFITADDLQWVDAPPVLPKGAKIAVLHGDPFKKGPFSIRFKVPDGYKVAPHYHSSAEEFTLLSGRFVFNMGDRNSPDTHELTTGGYHYLPAKTSHWVEAKGETVFQLSGTGPFDVVYLDPADNPMKKSASR